MIDPNQLQPTPPETVLNREALQRQFEELGRQPENEVVQLKETAIVLQDGMEPLSEDTDSGVKILALLEIPRDDESNGFLMLGLTPSKGYFLAGPTANSEELAKDITDETRINRGVAPLTFGREPGSRVTLGRKEQSWRDMTGKEYPLYPSSLRTITDEIGSHTSSRHFTVVVEHGQIVLRDHSMNGTRLVKHK